MKHIKTTTRVAPAVVGIPTDLYCKTIEVIGAPDILEKCGEDNGNEE